MTNPNTSQSEAQSEAQTDSSDQLETELIQGPPGDIAQHHQRLGRMLFEQYRDPASLSKAAGQLRQALTWWQEAKQPISEAACWVLLAEVLEARQTLAEAADAFRQAWKRFANSHQHREACDAALAASRLWLQHQDREQAEKLATLAQHEATAAHDHLRMAGADEAWARAIASDNPHAARKVAEQSLAVYQRFNAHTPQASCLELLAIIALKQPQDPADDNDPETDQLATDEITVDDQPDQLNPDVESFLSQALIAIERLGRPVDTLACRCRLAEALAGAGHPSRGLAILSDDQGQHGPSVRLGIDRRRIDLLLQDSQWQAAEALLAQTFDLAERVDHDEESARLQYLAARCALKRGDLAAAGTALEASRQAAQSVDHPRFHQRILAALARVQRQSGDHEAALKTMAEWVQVLRQLGDRHEQLRVLGDMGEVKLEQGNLTSAKAHFTRLLAVCREDDDLGERAFASRGLAIIASLAGDHHEAVKSYAAAIANYNACQPGPSRLVQAELHLGCGDSLVALDRFREGLDRYAYVLRLLGSHGGESNAQTALVRALHGVAACYRQLGDHQQAAEAEQRAQQLGEVQQQAPQTMLWRRGTEN